MAGQELELVGGAVRAADPSQIFTERLWKLATRSTSGGETAGQQREAIVRAIVADPALRAEARRILPQVQAMQGGATYAQFYEAMQPLLLVRKLPDVTNGMDLDAAQARELEKAWWRINYDALKDLPHAALKKGVADYIRLERGSWFPQPAEIRKHAEPHAIAIRTAAYRLKQAAEAPKPARERTPEEIAEGRAMVKDALARLGVRKGARGLPKMAATPQQAADRLRDMAAAQDGEDYA